MPRINGFEYVWVWGTTNGVGQWRREMWHCGRDVAILSHTIHYNCGHRAI